MIQLEQKEKDRLLEILKDCKEEALGKRVLITEFKMPDFVKSKSGLFIPTTNTNVFENTGGKNAAGRETGQPVSSHQFPSATALVISVGPKADTNAKSGDLIRFNPISAHPYLLSDYHILIIYDHDCQARIGSIVDTTTEKTMVKKQSQGKK